jgi:hypothetical protein
VVARARFEECRLVHGRAHSSYYRGWSLESLETAMAIFASQNVHTREARDRPKPTHPLCDDRVVPNCSGGLIQHIDGTIAGCTLDDDLDGCTGLEERHEDAPEICWLEHRFANVTKAW